MASRSSASGFTPERWPSESISMSTSKCRCASCARSASIRAASMLSRISVSRTPLSCSAITWSSLFGAMQTA